MVDRLHFPTFQLSRFAKIQHEIVKNGVYFIYFFLKCICLLGRVTERERVLIFPLFKSPHSYGGVRLKPGA